MKALVLAYHSHNIRGSTYEANDHVALASDLVTITHAGARIVPLSRIVQAMEDGTLEGGDDVVVGLTFDDGPIFDVDDFVHPQFGAQRSFLSVMSDFQLQWGREAQAQMSATSFVIASPLARRAMEGAEECGYTFMQGWLSDAWWARAADSGIFEIGNHSWDHVHSAPESIATRSQARGNFELVDNYDDADREIRSASEYINAIVGGRCNMFAFPFGHANKYLVSTYLPEYPHEHRMRAAFGTGGRCVQPGDSIWNVPRIVCGHHWKSPAELRELILR